MLIPHPAGLSEKRGERRVAGAEAARLALDRAEEAVESLDEGMGHTPLPVGRDAGQGSLPFLLSALCFLLFRPSSRSLTRLGNCRILRLRTLWLSPKLF